MSKEMILQENSIEPEEVKKPENQKPSRRLIGFGSLQRSRKFICAVQYK